MPVRWKTIPGYDLYLASTLGQIRHVRGKPLNPFRDNDGYGYVEVYKGGRGSGRQAKVGVLVLETFRGPRPLGYECCHSNGNLKDDRLSNLRWDTHSNNVYDAIEHGTHVCNIGEKNGKSKLWESDAAVILDRYLNGEHPRSIAKDFGLHPEYVRLIGKRIYWKHLFALVI